MPIHTPEAKAKNKASFEAKLRGRKVKKPKGSFHR